MKELTYYEIARDIIKGCKMGTSHLMWFTRYFVWDCFFCPVFQLLGLVENVERSIEENPGELKVVSLGFGRTGTFSVARALERLGYPTLHTQELYRHFDIMKMWMDEVVEPSIQAKKILKGSPNWDIITSAGFTSTGDFPSNLYFEELMERYPDAKFILTTKGAGRSHDWYRSWLGMTQAALQSVYVSERYVQQMKMYGKYFRWLIANVNQDPDFLTKPFPIHDNQDRDRVIQSYEEHNRLVREKVPPHRLLEYNLRDGWEPLCNFLEIDDCPLDEEFPAMNSAISKKFESLSSILYAVAITSLILFTLIAWLFRKLTGKTVVQWVSQRRNGKVKRC